MIQEQTILVWMLNDNFYQWYIQIKLLNDMFYTKVREYDLKDYGINIYLINKKLSFSRYLTYLIDCWSQS